MNEPSPRKTPPPAGFWIAIGVAIGCGVGVALRNPLLGIGIGGMLMAKRNR